jgi:hypothetical protein
MCLSSRCLAMNIYSDFTIPAFWRHVTIYTEFWWGNLLGNVRLKARDVDQKVTSLLILLSRYWSLSSVWRWSIFLQELVKKFIAFYRRQMFTIISMKAVLLSVHLSRSLSLSHTYTQKQHSDIHILQYWRIISHISEYEFSCFLIPEGRIRWWMLKLYRSPPNTNRYHRFVCI